MKNGGLKRFAHLLTFGEIGSNSGSNLAVISYADDGTSILPNNGFGMERATGNFSIYSQTASTSINSGALTVGGGAGFNGKVFANGLDANSQKISNIADPVSNTDAVNLQYLISYVNSIASGMKGLKVKNAADCATTGNINLSNPGTSTIDGVSLTSGVSSVIVWQQTTDTENGVYTFNGSGSAMTRRVDFGAGVDAAYWCIHSIGGSTYAKTTFNIPQDVAVLNTNAIKFTIFVRA